MLVALGHNGFTSLAAARGIVRRRRLLAAHRDHLDADLGHLGGGQLADLDAIEHLALVGPDVGRAARDLIAHRHVLQPARKGDALVATLEAPAQTLGLALAPLDERFRRSRRDDEQDRAQRVVVAHVVGLGVGGGEQVLFPDLQARLIASAHQLRPDHVGTNARLERVRVHAAVRELLRQLLGGHAHPVRHRAEGGVDLGVADLQPELLGLSHLELLVDELVDDFLPGRRLVVRRRQLVELGALLDVELGDRLTVDDDDDLLGMDGGGEQRQRDDQRR